MDDGRVKAAMVVCQETERGLVGLLLSGGGADASREGSWTVEGLQPWEEGRPRGLRWLAARRERGRGAQEAWCCRIGSGCTRDDGGAWGEEEEEDGRERDVTEVLGTRRKEMEMVKIMD